MLHSLIDSLINIVYPKTCTVCKTKLSGTSSVDEIICVQCWAKIKKNTPPFCHACGRHLEKPARNICPACIRKHPHVHFDRAFAPCSYEGVLKELIHDFKYRNKDYLGKTLSKPMIEFIKEYRMPIGWIDFIVPMPLYKTRMREREFNQSHILSRHVAAEFDKEVLDSCLKRIKPTRKQAELPETERFLNVKDCFLVSAKDKIKNKNILLVDDVLTTGATSSEAACALKKSGANIVFALTLAN